MCQPWEISNRMQCVSCFNYKESAGGMEPEGARRIFSRSLKRHKVRYTDLYGDGDSKSHETVKNIYRGIIVRKLQCVGHVQKRVGNRCLKLKKKMKGLGGRGKLTKRAIDRLQNYYGIAIRSNANNSHAKGSSSKPFSCCFIREQQLSFSILSAW